MPYTGRREIQRRLREVARLIGCGTPRRVIIEQVSEKYAINRRSATRYMERVEELLAGDLSVDPKTMLATTVSQLDHLFELALARVEAVYDQELDAVTGRVIRRRTMVPSPDVRAAAGIVEAKARLLGILATERIDATFVHSTVRPLFDAAIAVIRKFVDDPKKAEAGLHELADVLRSQPRRQEEFVEATPLRARTIEPGTNGEAHDVPPSNGS